MFREKSKYTVWTKEEDKELIALAEKHTQANGKIDWD
jgi:hypothetical protein